MNGKNIGDIGEITVLAEFIKRGIPVFIPYGENSKIDLIAIFNDKPQRIQVKTTGVIKDNGSYVINLRNCSIRKNGESVISKCTEKDIDYFALYCLERPEPLLFSFNELKDKTTITIRYDDRVFPNSVYEKDYLFSKKLDENLIHVKTEENGKTCIDCGIPIAKTSTRCISCSNKNNSLKRYNGCPYTRDELKIKIRTESFLQIGKENNVSDNAVRKWCDKLNLPRKKTDIDKYTDKEWDLI